MPAYFTSLRVAANSAAAPQAPASRAASVIYDSVRIYCDVPAQRLAALPRNEYETIWSLPVRPEQPDGLFGDGNPGRGKATSNQVVEGMMSS